MKSPTCSKWHRLAGFKKVMTVMFGRSSPSSGTSSRKFESQSLRPKYVCAVYGKTRGSKIYRPVKEFSSRWCSIIAVEEQHEKERNGVLNRSN